MALPPGINTATGLVVALSKLGLPRHVVVGIGDAENDHLLLAYCECGVAVENASLHFKQPPPLVTRGENDPSLPNWLIS